jgi:uncharacterized membrane protein
MVMGATAVMGVLALGAHLLDLPGFGDLVSVPVAGLVATCAMGIVGRLKPDIRRGLVAIVPRSLPRPELVVWFTAGCEFAAIVGLFVPPLRMAAAVCLVVFFCAVFPANIRAAHLKGDETGEFRRRILLRGGQQVVYTGLALWVAVASAA